MNISSTARVTPQATSTPSKRLADLKIPTDAAVSYDKEKDSFEFRGSGYSRTIERPNALVEGLKLGAVVAVPAFIGAAQNELFGTVAAGLGGTYTGVIGGLALGGALGGYKSYKGSNDNIVFGALGALGGAMAGAVAFPILKQPGLWGGLAGAAIATGLAVGGGAIFMAVQNHKVTEAAKELGWRPE